MIISWCPWCWWATMTLHITPCVFISFYLLIAKWCHSYASKLQYTNIKFQNKVWKTAATAFLFSLLRITGSWVWIINLAELHSQVSPSPKWLTMQDSFPLKPYFDNFLTYRDDTKRKINPDILACNLKK